MQLRTLSLDDTAAIDLVATRMRETLIEVEGEAVGGAMYSMDWLRDRVHWHLDGRAAEVVVADDATGAMVGHTIYRIESGGAALSAAPFGLISTTYVAPEARRLGVAQGLLAHAEEWFRKRHLLLSCTWTSETNRPLIALYARNGYVEAERGPNQLTQTMMVRLTKALTP
ncbi:GNAT family N-acetyltransferase [Roseateles chitinivorans]|uniref:GNAT family N-acetyltransferase n=1 Tax=Roseateles chitinivorans TaxID=2917965 RepID=UPI003D665637